MTVVNFVAQVNEPPKNRKPGENPLWFGSGQAGFVWQKMGSFGSLSPRNTQKSSKSFWILKDQDALATLSSPPFWDDGEWVNTWPKIRLVIHDQPKDLGNQKVTNGISWCRNFSSLEEFRCFFLDLRIYIFQEAKRTRRFRWPTFHPAPRGCQASLICLVSCWEAQNCWEEVLLDKSRQVQIPSFFFRLVGFFGLEKKGDFFKVGKLERGKLKAAKSEGSSSLPRVSLHIQFGLFIVKKNQASHSLPLLPTKKPTNKTAPTLGTVHDVASWR